MSDAADAAQRAWEREMEMAIEGRGRTRSRSILATHDDEDEDTSRDAHGDDHDNSERHSSSRRGGRGGDLEPLDTQHGDEATRNKSGSMERPVPVDIVDGGHDPAWLDSPASSDGGESFGRGRARSFTAKRTMEMEMEKDKTTAGATSRRRSRSFSSLNRNRNDDEDGEQQDEDEMAQIVRRATSLSKIYLVGSAPVDVSKLQDKSKIVGVKKVEVVEPTGALSTKALDALSEGLQSLSVDGVTLQAAGSKDESSLLSEAELEEKRMAEEEDKKLRSQKMSTRKTLSEKASFFKAKVFKAGGKTTGNASSNSPPTSNGAASKPSGVSSGSSFSGTTAASAASNGVGSSSAASATRKTDSATDLAALSPPPAPVKRHKLKLLLLGDSGVGKTSLMRVFSGDEFSESMLATAGVDFKLRNIAVGDDEIALQIWDTAGQERFHRITATYYKGANGIVLVYDVSDKKSFDNVGYWMNNIRQYASPNMPAMLLVGNKIDLPNRVVSTEEGLAAARQYNVRFIETSAKTSMNTNGALETIARDAFFMSLNQDSDGEGEVTAGPSQQGELRDLVVNRRTITTTHPPTHPRNALPSPQAYILNPRSHATTVAASYHRAKMRRSDRRRHRHHNSSTGSDDGIRAGAGRRHSRLGLDWGFLRHGLAAGHLHFHLRRADCHGGGIVFGRAAAQAVWRADARDDLRLLRGVVRIASETRRRADAWKELWLLRRLGRVGLRSQQHVLLGACIVWSCGHCAQRCNGERSDGDGLHFVGDSDLLVCGLLVKSPTDKPLALPLETLGYGDAVPMLALASFVGVLSSFKVIRMTHGTFQPDDNLLGHAEACPSGAGA